MRWSRTNAPFATHITTVSTDAPFIPLDLVMRLRDGVVGRPTAIAIARSGGALHPVIGLWPVALADDLEFALRDGVRKVLAWTGRHGTQAVDFPFTPMAGCQIDPFFNANHPDEFDEARRLLQG